MYMQPPKKLVDLCLFASLMRAGAEAVGGAKGVELFVDEFVVGLLRKRWPIPGDKYEPAFGPMHEFVMEKVSSFNAPRYTIDTDLGTWLQESATAETREFLCDPDNLQTMEDVLNITLQAITKAYGNPLNAAPLAKSYLKQSFDAIKNNTVEAKTEQLDEVLAFVSAGLQKYNKNDLPAKEFLQRDLLVNEFWQRTEEKLTEKDWPFSHDADKPLMDALKLMARSGSYAKLMNAVERLAKADPSLMPPERAEGIAWCANFILSNSKDLKETAGTVFQGLEKEAKTPRGINLTRSALSRKISLN
ncbi:MAG: hypothetical protein K8R48_03925 [Alphaproteobacteria bacterium]|nr:hypothetical protein [Alphaproteobacteria bacterium]